MHRFYLSPDQIRQPEPAIMGSDAHHIQTVLRLKPGDAIVVFDGLGGEYDARIITMDHRRVGICVADRRMSNTESPVKIALAQSYLKDKKMDLLVRQVVELGVNHFVPFMARRSVPQPDAARMRGRHQRWCKIALEAVKQCRRGRTMEVSPLQTFEETLRLAAPYAMKLFFWEVQGDRLMHESASASHPESIFIMIGPEGGFEADEYEVARRHGFIAVQMGPRILRVETAAVAACTLVQYLFGDMGAKIA